MISHKHKCIFIHIHKTAGTSIENKLGLFRDLKRNVQDHRTIRQIEPQAPLFLMRKALLQAASLSPREAARLVKKMIFPAINSKLYREYFKFSFVRNSWSRVYSLYHGVMRDEIHRKTLKIETEITLPEFLKIYRNKWALQSQLYWLFNEKEEIPLDFIGRFEKLESDFAIVCGHLGIEDASLPKLLVANNPPYHEYYDEVTRDLVYKMYREEIARFKFEFGE